MKLTEEQATEQLRILIGSLIDLPDKWDPMNVESDDKYILQWIKHPQNNWCSGKKYDFETLTKMDEYAPGQYAWVILTILGFRVYGRE